MFSELYLVEIGGLRGSLVKVKESRRIESKKLNIFVIFDECERMSTLSCNERQPELKSSFANLYRMIFCSKMLMSLMSVLNKK